MEGNRQCIDERYPETQVGNPSAAATPMFLLKHR